ncbi:MAG TPA: class I SAM-dependent methyltransferase [Marmoricola sp.]|nr:class I SAM-dependent methyltransferase [Marmoricola sp.]
MDLESFAWLRTTEGQETLASAARLYDDGADPIRAGELLRRSVAPGRAAAAMSQAQLRVAARAKLGEEADRMYFTKDGLEQATRHEVARHRAARLALARPGSVVDLGCGIGGDLVELARAGLTTAGVDLDPLRVAVARANLEALGLPGAVMVADVTALDLSPFGAVFADPARRTARGRVFDVDAYAPPWSFVESLLTGTACVKVAPGIPHDRVPSEVEAEWVSFRGDVKEAVLWSPVLATTERRATLVHPAGLATLTAEDDPGPAPARPVGRYLLEPDGAVIRAGLVTAVAARVEGWLVDENIAYLSCDTVPTSSYARAFEVLEELPFHEKQLRAALRSRGVGRLTIKKRGVAVVPEQLRKRLALRGDAEATVVLTRVAGRGTALLVRPLG